MGEIIKSKSVVISGERGIGELKSSDKHFYGEPQIRVNKKEGVVESIDIICVCGQHIRLICEYEKGSGLVEMQQSSTV